MGLTVTEKLIATSLVAGKMERGERIGIRYMSPEDFGKY